MAEKVRNIFLSEKFILLVIIINSVVIFLQESGFNTPLISALDILCTVIFIIEMVSKHINQGVKGYWSQGWNRLDGTLVLLSLPSLVTYFLPVKIVNLSILLILRILRVFRFFRVIHIFPNFGQIVKGLWRALKDSLPIFAGFLILIIVFALFSCAMFKDVSPQFFGTPIDAIYSTFRLCTVEGWYEIPDSMSTGLTVGQIAWVRIYFVFILIAGGIIGLSLVNSVFVDAMVADNNDQLEADVKELTARIEELTEEIRKSKDNG